MPKKDKTKKLLVSSNIVFEEPSLAEGSQNESKKSTWDNGWDNGVE